MLMFAKLIVKLNVVINSNFVRTRHQGLLGGAFTMVAGPDRRCRSRAINFAKSREDPRNRLISVPFGESRLHMNDERFPRNHLDDKLKQAGKVQCSAANMQSQLKHLIKRKPNIFAYSPTRGSRILFISLRTNFGQNVRTFC